MRLFFNFIVVVIFIIVMVGKPISGCKEQADIMFLLDNSGSIGPDVFKNVKEFVGDFPGADIKMGPYDYQIGVMNYHVIQQELALNKFTDQISFRKAVNDIKYHGGSTRTDEAISKMYQSSFSKDNGGRPGTAKICIILTDGDSKYKQQTQIEAKKARDSGIFIFVIGVGSKFDERDKSELNEIASDPSSQFVYTTALTNSLRKTLTQRVCDVSRPNPPASCSSKADIVFVLDSSGSITSPNFNIILSFVKQFIKSFPIGQNSYVFGVLTFGHDTHVEFNLDSNRDISSTMAAVDKIEYTGGGTETGLALQSVHETMFKPYYGDRISAKNIAIIITDGRASDHKQAIEQAKVVKKAGIKLYAVGIGERVDLDEIEKIVEDQGNDYNGYMLSITDFINLQENINGLIKKMCKDT